MIIDTHLHLIDLSALRYPWLGGVPALKRDFPHESMRPKPDAPASRLLCIWRSMSTRPTSGRDQPCEGAVARERQPAARRLPPAVRRSWLCRVSRAQQVISFR